jgi:two-component system cell cycle sensor histidine kinase/response regulator CckA
MSLPRPTEADPPSPAASDRNAQAPQEVVPRPGDRAETPAGSVAAPTSKPEAAGLLRALIDAAPLNMSLHRVVRDASGTVVDWEVIAINPTAATAAGMSRERMEGRRGAELVPAAAHGAQLEVLRRLIATGTAQRFDAAPPRGDRTYVSTVFLVGGDVFASISLDVTTERRTTRDLARREAELREAQRICRTGSWTWDAATDASTWSDELYAVAGIDPSGRALAPSTIAAACSPASAAAVTGAISRAMTTGESIEIEAEVVQPGGEHLWVIVRVAAMLGADGSVAGLHGTVTDITARRQAEEALRSSEARYRLLAEGVTDQIVAIDGDRRCTYWNSEAENATGIPASEAIGRPIAEVLPQAVGTDVERALHEVLTGEGARTVLQDLVVRGEARSFEASLYPIDGGAMVLSRDVTERIRAERAVRASADLYRGVVDSVGDGVVVHGPDGRIVAMNGRAEVILGAGLDELGRRDAHDPRWQPTHEDGTPFPADEHPATITLRTGEAVGNVVMGLTRPDGGRLLVSAGSEPLVGPGGEVTGAVVSFVDVTALRQLEQQLREAQKLEAIGRLAGGIAHDFNNLLTAISGSAEILADSIPVDDPRHAEVDEIRRAGARAAGLTRQLLAFGRRQLLRPADVAVDEAVADLETMLKRTLGGNIVLSVVAPAVACRARVDRVQLEQVILNLVLNARDAMPDGGTLTIETALAQAGDAVCPPAGGGAQRWVRLSVTDTGIGMDAETVAHIFEPFFSTKEAARGTGLGLATVHGIVAQSGGSIDVASDPGRGSTFTVLLPRAAGPREPEPATEGPPAPAHSAVGPVTILVAEDDTAVRVFTRRVLREHGYRVLEASSGDEALRIAAVFPDPIDILGTDVLMPGLSGPALALEIGQERPGIRTLFVSGFAPESVFSSGTPGSAAFLGKPFSRADLLSRVAALGEPDPSVSTRCP